MKKVKSPWSFEQPEYDQRSSCFINAGTHHGVGKTQPVGSKTYSNKLPFPVGSHNMMKVDDVGKANKKIDMEE